MKFKPLYNPHTLTCTITIGDWAACTGIQKLIGFSRGWHHWNSIRLGYNRSENSDVIRLWLYTYIGGKQKSKVIGGFNPGEVVNVELYYWGNTYIEAVVNHKVTTLYNGNNPIKFGYLLFPYAEIDGTEIKTPLNVDIKDLKINGKIVKIK